MMIIVYIVFNAFDPALLVYSYSWLCQLFLLYVCTLTHTCIQYISNNQAEKHTRPAQISEFQRTLGNETMHETKITQSFVYMPYNFSFSLTSNSYRSSIFCCCHSRKRRCMSKRSVFCWCVMNKQRNYILCSFGQENENGFRIMKWKIM